MATSLAPETGDVGFAPSVRDGATRRPRLPVAVGERVRKVTLAAIGVLAVLNVADVVTTRIVLGTQAVEANPLSAVLLADQQLLWVKLAILIALALKVLHSRPRLGVMAAACFATGIYATAVLSNLLVLHLAAH